jgi:hypothetical protein
MPTCCNPFLSRRRTNTQHGVMGFRRKIYNFGEEFEVKPNDRERPESVLTALTGNIYIDLGDGHGSYTFFVPPLSPGHGSHASFSPTIVIYCSGVRILCLYFPLADTPQWLRASNTPIRVLGSQHAVATAKYARVEPTSTFSRFRCAGRRPLYTFSAPFEPPCTFVSPRSTV